MRTLRKNGIPLIVLVVVVVVAVALVAYGATSSERRSPSDTWLSHFVGDEVVVTFISAPPDMGKTIKSKLMDAESAGIVLKIEDQEIFFTFANIIAVEPSHT